MSGARTLSCEREHVFWQLVSMHLLHNKNAALGAAFFIHAALMHQAIVFFRRERRIDFRIVSNKSSFKRGLPGWRAMS
jgi:hypothetical protein